MRLVQHPNVVRLYEVIDTPTTLYLVMELAEGGDLYDYILRHEGGVAESTAKRHFAQIVRAVAYCHQLHVVHRDLKPENVVFFPQQGAVKLTDFGFSNLFQPGTMLATSCGSLAYSAPEILLGEEYDAPAVGEEQIYFFLVPQGQWFQSCRSGPPHGVMRNLKGSKITDRKEKHKILVLYQIMFILSDFPLNVAYILE